MSHQPTKGEGPQQTIFMFCSGCTTLTEDRIPRSLPGQRYYNSAALEKENKKWILLVIWGLACME